MYLYYQKEKMYLLPNLQNIIIMQRSCKRNIVNCTSVLYFGSNKQHKTRLLSLVGMYIYVSLSRSVQFEVVCIQVETVLSVCDDNDDRRIFAPWQDSQVGKRNAGHTTFTKNRNKFQVCFLYILVVLIHVLYKKNESSYMIKKQIGQGEF